MAMSTVMHVCSMGKLRWMLLRPTMTLHLAACLATYNAEKHRRDEKKKEEKKKKDEEKEAKKRLQKEKEAKEHEMILPGCTEDVEDRGKVWVLGCSVNGRRKFSNITFIMTNHCTN